MPYIPSTLIAKRHGWGDTPPAGQSVGAAIGSLLSGLLGGNAQPAPVVQQSDNTGTYLLLGAAGIGAFLLLRRKKR